MKLLIDTESKTILLEQPTNLRELFEQLLDWEIDLDEYSISTGTTLTTYPVEIPDWVGPHIVYGGD